MAPNCTSSIQAPSLIVDALTLPFSLFGVFAGAPADGCLIQACFLRCGAALRRRGLLELNLPSAGHRELQ